MCIIQYEVAIGYISIQCATCNFHLFPLLCAHQIPEKFSRELGVGVCVCFCMFVRVIKRARRIEIRV